jgi:dienelactone hydrolase
MKNAFVGGWKLQLLSLFRCSAWCAMLVALSGSAVVAQEEAGPVAGTKLLTMEGDLASELVAGADRFLLKELEQSLASRESRWNRDFSSPAAYEKSIEPNRQRLRQMLGARDGLADKPVPRFESTVQRSSLVGRGSNYEVHEVSWGAFSDVTGAGLLLVPTQPLKAGEVRPDVIAIPDCEVQPEQLVGMSEGVPASAQYARLLAERGCRVLVPLLINRAERMQGLSNREWLYRPAFELGRGLVAYEVEKVLAAVKWMRGESGESGRIGVFGWGEGGMLALYAGALDPEIDVVGVSGYFDSRQEIWQQPIDRNVFGLLSEFGDAELASLILPRRVVIDASRGPQGDFSGARGAPWKLDGTSPDRVKQEFERLRAWSSKIGAGDAATLVASNGDVVGASVAGLQAFYQQLSGDLSKWSETQTALEPVGSKVDSAARMNAQIAELDRHSQMLLRESHYVRQERTIGRLDFANVEAYEKSAAKLREEFKQNVIGSFDRPMLSPKPRSRVFQETEKWTAYEVVLDVFPDVYAYGLLLVPKGIKPGERRPVVVCQHGLEGRPQDTIGQPGYDAYKAFTARLAERGFITFAPQNLYIFTDRFRSLQRKANPLGKTLFSLITPQHQQIVDWLQTLDMVDPQRIGFYGLSYGGKTAMRVPAMVTDYCLSICSADFNEWVDKNASTRNPRTYANMGEYEIFEFDLGSTFNYAEMAALIAPRPFMVERGHFDGVADDWTVAYEYSKVQFLYAARLKRPELTEIEWFDGPHTINGKKTFEFLHRHLNWPAPVEAQK